MQRGTKPMPRSSKPLPAVNPARKAKRQQRYKRYLSSAAWKARRAACFARAGHRCERVVEGVRCPNPPTVADHLTYARFGHELPEDLRALCRSCDRIETKLHRANHFSPR
jgi:5-methylcytosine-specific restriction endonuclease McrA